MVFSITGAAARARRFARLFLLSSDQRRVLRHARRLDAFDPVFYRTTYGQIHSLYHRFGLRHFIVYGEGFGFRPNADFSPQAYLAHNSDVAAQGLSAFAHWVLSGHREGRIAKELPRIDSLPDCFEQIQRPLREDATNPGSDPDVDGNKARFAVAVHVYYPDLWPEIAAHLSRLSVPFDLFVTITYRGDETTELAADIAHDFPGAFVHPVENRGRDILPFLMLVNAGLLHGYEAVCKLHTKKSPHRQDGDDWRRHLIGGVLPIHDLAQKLDHFVNDRAAIWVADGQVYQDARWWGSNFAATRDLLRRVEIEITEDALCFPAGSIYWLKPMMVGMLAALDLGPDDFEGEQGQLDGTLAHAVERALGGLAQAGGWPIAQTTELGQSVSVTPKFEEQKQRPGFVTAFYLPQFHPTPENDRWWGKGFTEWRGVVQSKSRFAGHRQPILPSDLGFYDLRVTDVMGEQAALAQSAGIDAFCVYHYWFDGKRMLHTPLDRLLTRADVAFPFYLCWANESWRRNWDGLSGQVLLDQSYAPGFEDNLVRDSLPYLRDPRYARPDGRRPRFMIYRPGDMPNPVASVEKMRRAWRRAGLGDVELGAVLFHQPELSIVPDDLFDFWVEMPPHGLVQPDAYLFGGPKGNRLNRPVDPNFQGLVYDYAAVIRTAFDPKYLSQLPKNTITGAMPGWDNSARRGQQAHIAYGANPASFAHWVDRILSERLGNSYRGELFLNAWNEWAEKAILEPNDMYGDLMLGVLRDRFGAAATPSISDAA